MKTPRRAMLRRLPALGALPLMGLGGCGSLDNAAPRFDFFVIEDLRKTTPPSFPAPSTPTGPARPRIDRTLLLTTGPTQALYDSDRMVYTRDREGLAYYQYSNWSERPARRILTLVEARLTHDGAFRAVASTVAGVRGDLVLSLRLDELLHDDSVQPGAVRLSVTADLLDWRTRQLVARRTFEHSAPVPLREARGAARAANEAVTAMLDALSVWTEKSAASPA
jgi:cholesterol transport system auxiliary component